MPLHCESGMGKGEGERESDPIWSGYIELTGPLRSLADRPWKEGPSLYVASFCLPWGTVGEGGGGILRRDDHGRKEDSSRVYPAFSLFEIRTKVWETHIFFSLNLEWIY